MNMIARNKTGSKERPTLNMIPVGMGHENMKVALVSAAHHIVTQATRSSAHIKNQLLIAAPNLYAGRVSTDYT